MNESHFQDIFRTKPFQMKEKEKYKETKEEKKK